MRFIHHSRFSLFVLHFSLACDDNAPVKRLFFSLLCTAALLPLLPAGADAAVIPTLTYRYGHLLFTMRTSDAGEWQGQREAWTYRGQPVSPPAVLRVDGDDVPPLPPGFERGMKPAWDTAAIERTLAGRVASQIDRDAGSVTISRNASGAIVFDGAGFPGRKVDLELAARLTVEALENGSTDIAIPVIETQPDVRVTDESLRAQGIRELVTIGESDFSGSTQNRIHNIRVGLDRFSGHLIAQGETFSFVEVLGPVDGSTGYRKELTIIGDKTLPDYGGGLCQVSSTAYRGVWEYGFPIVQRKNHSYAVHYYAPQGTDATVYPPDVDIKFLNDSPGALLIQTVIDVPANQAYFLYYGTRDDREADVFGPFSWDHRSAPPPRTEYTTDIPTGTRRKVGDAVPGVKTAWFRVVRSNGEENVEGVYSTYQARPLYWQIGVDVLPTGSGSLTDAPASEAVISD